MTAVTTGEQGMQVRPKLSEIQRVVARRNGISLEAIKSSCRKKEYAWPRQIAVALCRDLTLCSYPEIARAFSYKDHTAGVYAFQKLTRLRKESPELEATLQEYVAEINADARERFERMAPLMIEPAPEPPNVHRLARQKREPSPEIVEANMAMGVGA